MPPMKDRQEILASPGRAARFSWSCHEVRQPGLGAVESIEYTSGDHVGGE